MSYDSPRPDAVAHNLLLPAAEMGLLYRPIHLLVGNLPWSECVSPYTRDLTITLEQFASRQTKNGHELRAKPTDTFEREDWYYEIAKHFLQEDKKRRDEKIQIEASLGMMRLHDNYPNTLWIDSKRLDWDATDSRISSIGAVLTKPYPVWVILNPKDFEEFIPLLEELVRKLSRQLISCTLALKLDSEQMQNIQSESSTTRFYEITSTDLALVAHEQATQTMLQSLDATITATPEPTQPEAPKPKTGPIHRIKA